MINDGQRVRALESNAAWASKSADNTLGGVQTLNNGGSGPTVTNVQQSINDANSNISTAQNDITNLQSDVSNLQALNTFVYLGDWNATTNSPTLADGDGGGGVGPGATYRVAVAGTQDLGSGSIVFNVGDKVVYRLDGIWEQWDVSDEVTSVNGQAGIVVLDTDDISEGATNKYFTDERAQDAVGTILVDSATIDLNYNDATPEITADVVDGSITNAKLSDVPTQTIKGRTTAGTGDPEDLTAAQATAILDPFTSGLKGLAPASGGGTVNFLRADGTWQPAGASGANTSLSNLTTTSVNEHLIPSVNLVKTLGEPATRWASAYIDNTEINRIYADQTDLFLAGNSEIINIESANQVVAPTVRLNNEDSSASLGLKAPEGAFTDQVYTLPVDPVEGNTLITDAAGNLSWAPPATGALNWISNSGVEFSDDGYSTYADAAGTTPVDGTGGSPNVTVARNTSSPLNGVADLLFDKDAANRQGEGFSYDFTIDSAYQGSVQQIAFNYKILSGTYASGDLTVWIYDVTNGVLLPQPSGNSIISTSVPSQHGQCTFQTSINSTSYRLIVHVTTTSASAYSLQFDNISVGPQVGVSGGVDTAATQFTPVAVGTGLGTIAGAVGKWSRSGQFLFGEFTFTTGTTTGNSGGITIPGSVSLDITALSIPANIISSIGSVVGSYVVTSGATNQTGLMVTAPGTSTTTIYFAPTDGAATNHSIPSSSISTNVSASSTVINVNFRVPISGWASNNVLSTSGNTRAVVFTGTNASQSLTANTTNASLTATRDTVAGWSTNIYTVQVPGDYYVSCGWTVSNSSAINIYKNGSSFQKVAESQNTWGNAGSIIMPNLVVGDTISFRSNVNITATLAYASISLLQSPQQIAASESINAKYHASSTTITGSLATIVWTTKDYDSHNSMSSGLYTVSAPGKYRVSASLALSGTFVLNNQNIIEVQKNSTATKNVTKYLAAAVTNDNLAIDDEIDCSTGDVLRVQASSGGTTPAIVSSNTKNVITISRIGN